MLAAVAVVADSLVSHRKRLDFVASSPVETEFVAAIGSLARLCSIEGSSASSTLLIRINHYFIGILLFLAPGAFINGSSSIPKCEEATDCTFPTFFGASIFI